MRPGPESCGFSTSYEMPSERRRVNRAVIRRLGNFIDMSHLADPELVHDFARLLIAPFIDLAPLIFR